MKVVLSAIFGASALLALSGGAYAQDAAAGEQVFKKCGKFATRSAKPPRTWSARCSMGSSAARRARSRAIPYSDANKNSGITWDEATLKVYLKNPREKVPGTKMTFPGLTSQTDIDNVIAYLKQFGPDGKSSKTYRRRHAGLSQGLDTAHAGKRRL